MRDQIKTQVTNPIGIPFIRARLVDDNLVLESQKQRSREIVDENPAGYGSNWADHCGSWNSTEVYEDGVLKEEEVFSPITENLDKLVSEFTDAMSMDWDRMSPIITDSWLNANPPGNVQECHIHGHCYIAAVYYIHIPEGEPPRNGLYRIIANKNN